MPLNIRDPEVHELARAVAAATGETMTEAVRRALRERLERVGAADTAERDRRVRAILDWAAEWRRAPLVDPRQPPESMVDYDENGLPR